jgi:hypothetical protein
MIDKAHLQDRQVAFRLVGSTRVNTGVVKLVEVDGFWIESAHFLGEMQQDRGWGPAVEQIQKPVFFVPTSSLMFMIATQE